MEEKTSTPKGKQNSFAPITNGLQVVSSIGAPPGELGMFAPSIFRSPVRLQAAEMTAFLTSTELEIRPEFECRYEPFRTEVRFEIVGDDAAKRRALHRLRSAAPPGDVDECRDQALLLMAKTKSRPIPANAQKLLLADFVRIMREYPLSVVVEVVGKWDEREGDEGIFTPASAELRRALNEAAPVFVALARTLAA